MKRVMLVVARVAVLAVSEWRYAGVAARLAQARAGPGGRQLY
jgi:hypothetical protein